MPRSRQRDVSCSGKTKAAQANNILDIAFTRFKFAKQPTRK